VSPGEKVVVAAFGQGVDVLVFEVTEALASAPVRRGIRGSLANGKATDNYHQYLAFNDLITLEKGMRAERDDYKTALTVTWRKRDMLLGLVGGRCTRCGTLQFPRQDVCVNPQCRAHHTQEPHPFRDEPASVLTWSADYLTYIPNPPSHYGMITFANGGRFMTDFTDVDLGELDVGTEVKMMFRIKSVDSLRGFVRYFCFGRYFGHFGFVRYFLRDFGHFGFVRYFLRDFGHRRAGCDCLWECGDCFGNGG
jgi:uncharacterized OB-fold protein